VRVLAFALGAALLAFPLAASAGRAYVSNEDDGSVSVLDTARGEVIGTITVGKRPRGLALSRDGSRLYVAVSGVPKCSGARCSELRSDPAADGVSVVDTRGARIVGLIQAGSDPVELALARGERQLFVASSDSTEMAVLDVRARAVIAHVRVGRDPLRVRVSSNGDWVAVASRAENIITLIDGHLLESVRTLRVGRGPLDLVFAPDGRAAYVADELDATVYRIGIPSESPSEGGPVRAIPTRKLLQLRRLDRPLGIALDAAHRRLYVSTGSAGTIAVVALDGPKLIGEVPVGVRPRGLALTPDDRLLFAANGGSNDVSVVDTATLRVIGRIRVGRSPWGVAIEQ
jgi:YVTN family beta-propeller protein